MDKQHLWIVALVLTKTTLGNIAISQTISWQFGGTENEAVGKAVAFAQREKPGYAIEMVTPTCVTGIAATGSAAGSKVELSAAGVTA